MRDGALTLAFSTELDWEHGCRWGTTARLGGTVLVHGEPSPDPLAWSYHDHVVAGKDGAGPCTATTSVHVRAAPGDRDVWKPTEPDPDHTDPRE